MFKCKTGECYLISIEGADKVGKATQAALLETNLADQKVKAVALEVPWEDQVTYDLIYKMLYNGEAVDHPLIFQTLHATNRRSMLNAYFPNLAAHFDVLILDRWLLSTWVYGACCGITAQQNEVILQGIPTSDLTFVLDAPPWGAGDDYYERDSGFQSNVRATFRESAQEDASGKNRLVDATRTRQAIAEEIYRESLRFLARAAVPGL